MFGFLAQVLDDLARERRRQASIRELDKLSDHLLADVGLRRDQLPTLALELADEKERDRALAPASVLRPNFSLADEPFWRNSVAGVRRGGPLSGRTRPSAPAARVPSFDSSRRRGPVGRRDSKRSRHPQIDARPSHLRARLGRADGSTPRGAHPTLQGRCAEERAAAQIPRLRLLRRLARPRAAFASGGIDRLSFVFLSRACATVGDYLRNSALTASYDPFNRPRRLMNFAARSGSVRTGRRSQGDDVQGAPTLGD